MFNHNACFKALLSGVAALSVLAAQGQMVQDPMLSRSVSVEPNLLLMFDDSLSMPGEFIYQYGGSPGVSGMSGPTVANAKYAPDVNLMYYDPRATFLPRINANGTRQTAGSVSAITSYKVYWRTCEPTSSSTALSCTGVAYTTTSVPLYAIDYIPAPSLLSSGASSTAYPITTTAPVTTKGPRADSRAYALNATISVSTSDGKIHVYKATQAGTSALSQPVGYTGATGQVVNDGTAKFKEQSTAVGLYPKFKSRTDCLALAGYCTAMEELQNYANWEEYYKSRLEMVKTSLGEAFQPLGATLRLGWGAINVISSTSSLGSATQTASGGGAGVSLYNTAVKNNFYTWLYARTGPTASTPNRRALDKVGQYFSRKDNDGPWGNTPNPASTSTSATTGTASTAQASCRRSYALLVTDGYWNDSAPSVGNADNTPIAANTLCDTNAKCFTYTPSPPFADSASNTLADVAFKYWGTDLRTDLPNNVASIPGSNESFWQNLSFYAVSLGLDGSLPQTDATITKLSSATTAPGHLNWPAPPTGGNDPKTIDDMWHATINGRGSLINAASTSSLTAAIGSMLSNINSLAGTQSGVAVSTANLTNGTRKYTPGYTTVTWNGNVIARNLDATTGSETTTAWKVESGQDTTTGNPITTIPDMPARTIVTWNGTSAVAFNASSTGLSSALVDYLSGKPDLEQRNAGGIYRNRTTRLGDIVNSTPALIKNGVNLNYQMLPGSEAGQYPAYLAFKQARTDGVIFVGANDGMLHAFRDGGSVPGQEVFAFVPKAVVPNLHKLASPDYGTSANPHQYYVDGPNTETDAFWGGSWKNLLLGTTGAGVGAAAAPFYGGAKTVFALDVSNPLSMTASNVLWEINPGTSGFAELGHVLSDVQAGQTTDGTWVAIFGNGYASTSGKARLYVVNLQTGALVNDINTGVGNATTKNGLGGVRLVRNALQQVIGAYGGDLYGNMWKFDLSSGAASGVVANGATPLYTTSVGQPITAAPAVLPHPNGGFMVAFGTGKFFENSDLTNLTQQSMYGIWDSVGFGAPSSGSTLSGTARLVQQQVITVPVTANGVTTNYYAASNNAVAYTPVSGTSPKGWYMNLQYSGQRVVFPVEVAVSPFVIVDSISPAGAVVAGDLCSAANKGQGWSYIVNMLSGGAPSSPIIDITGNGITDASDKVTGASNPSNWVVMGVGTLADGRNTLLGVGAATTNITTATPTTSATLGTATLGATNTSSSTTTSNGTVTKTTITTVVTAIPGGEGGGYSTMVTVMVTVNPPLSNPTQLVSLSGGSSSAQLFTIDCADTTAGCGCPVPPNEYMSDGACCMTPSTVVRVSGQPDQCCTSTSCSPPTTVKGRQWRQLFMR